MISNHRNIWIMANYWLKHLNSEMSVLCNLAFSPQITIWYSQMLEPDRSGKCSQMQSSLGVEFIFRQYF